MKGRVRQLGVVSLFLIAFAAFTGLGQDNVAPMGIFSSPPESSELEVHVWVDQAAYQIDDPIVISYSVNQAAYIYIWDILPDGTAVQIFPNETPGGSENFVQAGEHVVPGNWQIGPPLGTEYVQILATTSPVDPFSFFSPQDPAGFQMQVEAQILGILPVTQRSWNFTSFEIVDVPPSSYGVLIVNSTPPGASIYIDGQYAGYTPHTLFVTQGFHQIAVSKPGYLGWQAATLIIGNITRTINVTLVPLFPTNAAPTADFLYSPVNPPVGAYVHFDGSGSTDSDGSVVSYAWSYGDGSTAVGVTQWHPFNSPGTYVVTLTVTDDDGATDTMTQAIQVGFGNQAPVAAFSASPTNPMVNAWVQFNASASVDADGSIVSYVWNYGDGSTDSGAVKYHPFSAPGTYMVTLTVTDDDGATDTMTQPVQVGGGANAAPTASFTSLPASPTIGEWVRFDGAGSTDSDGSISSYQWSYGDGHATSPSINSYAYYAYPGAGTYAVSLTVTDDDGASDTTTQYITVGSVQQSPVAQFSFVPTAPAVGESVSFNASTSYDPDGVVVSYRWDLDGNGVDDAFTPIINATYNTPGVAMVRLTVIDNDGLSTTSSQAVVVTATGGTPGVPIMGTTPGVFVWGTDSWHLTVNAGAGWLTPHSYRLELRSDDAFQSISQSSSGSAAPMGILPEPTDGNKTLVFEGSLQAGSVDYEFRVPNSTSLWMKLELDVDGDGTLETSSSRVYLRHSMVHPPTSPFVVGLPGGSSDELTPGMDFRIGFAIGDYGLISRFVIYTTTISILEAP